MAKIRHDQLQATLSRGLAPAYLVTGDEVLLVQEACDSIRQAAVKQGYSERELHHTDAGFQWEALHYSSASLSLFADKKIIEIRCHNGKPGTSGSNALVDYCASASEDNLLLLVFPKIDKRSQNSAWFKALDKLGSVVTIWPISAQQLPVWIGQRLAAAGLTATRDAIEILASKVEGNLLAAAQEIEKLKLIVDDQVIDAHMMADAVTDSARYDVFGLVDKALLGESRAAVTNLNGLRGEGSEPTIVLWALSKEIRSLAAIKEAMENGKSFDLGAHQAGVWDNRKAMVKHAAYRLHTRQLHTMLRKCGNADRMIKGISKGSVWDLLLDIVLSLSGVEAMNPRSQKLSLQSGY